jgi:hypothetical protein
MMLEMRVSRRTCITSGGVTGSWSTTNVVNSCGAMARTTWRLTIFGERMIRLTCTTGRSNTIGFMLIKRITFLTHTWTHTRFSASRQARVPKT